MIKHDIIQSMHDDLDGIYPLPKLKQEVITGHLIPRKMPYAELRRDIVYPIISAVFVTSLLSLLHVF